MIKESNGEDFAMFDFIKKNFGKVKVISGLILIGMGIYMIAF